MIKTAIENKQNLTVEGCYIPFDWQKDFSPEYLAEIKYLCLVMSENYIKTHFDDIKSFANVIEQRIDDDFTIEDSLSGNKAMLEGCKKYGLDYVYIDKDYEFDVEL